MSHMIRQMKAAKLSRRIARLDALCTDGRGDALTYVPYGCVALTVYRGPNKSPVDVCVEDSATGCAWFMRRGTWRELRLTRDEVAQSALIIDSCAP